MAPCFNSYQQENNNPLEPVAQGILQQRQNYFLRFCSKQTVRYLVHKGLLLQQLRLLQRYASGAHIKELVLAETPHRCAVRALHIICIDNQMRPCIGARIGRDQQIIVGLIGLCLLRILKNGYASLEARYGTAGQYPLEELVA